MLALQASTNDGRCRVLAAHATTLAATTSASPADVCRHRNAPAVATCNISLARLWAQLEANLKALAAQEAATESRRHTAATPAPVLMMQASADDNRRHVAASPTLVLAAEEAANERM